MPWRLCRDAAVRFSCVFNRNVLCTRNVVYYSLAAAGRGGVYGPVWRWVSWNEERFFLPSRPWSRWPYLGRAHTRPALRVAERGINVEIKLPAAAVTYARSRRATDHHRQSAVCRHYYYFLRVCTLAAARLSFIVVALYTADRKQQCGARARHTTWLYISTGAGRHTTASPSTQLWHPQVKLIENGMDATVGDDNPLLSSHSLRLIDVDATTMSRQTAPPPDYLKTNTILLI